MGKVLGLVDLIWTEIRDDWLWYAAWVSVILGYLILAVTIYPGEDAIKRIFDLFQNEDIFKAFLGNIGGKNPDYILWMTLLYVIMAPVYFVFGMMTGVRLMLRSVDKYYGEILFSLPMRRTTLHVARLIEGLIVTTSLFLLNSILLLIPWFGKTIPFERVVLLSLWGFFYTFTAIVFGMAIGSLSGDTGKGLQITMLFGLLLYAVQALSRVQENLKEVNDYNLLSWFDPNSALLENKIPEEIGVKLAIFCVIVLVLSFVLFLKRDLIKNPPLFPRVSLFSKRKIRNLYLSTFIKKGSSDRNSIFTFWARLFEKKFPFAADFIYSEKRVFFAVFWGIVLIWPFQLLFYPGNEETLKLTIQGFGKTPLMRLFTYGHNLIDYPYVWFTVTQAIGNHWFFFVPLVFYWVGKIIRKDTATMTGEIMASFPVNPRRVTMERFSAAMLEMIIFVLQMVFWLILSEIVIGKMKYTTNEILAVLAVLPLYIFLLSFLLSLGLLIQEHGVKIARLALFLLFFGFVVGKMVESLDVWYVTMVFGLYDPVPIILEGSLTANNYGVIIHGILAIISVIILYLASLKYKWMYVHEYKTTTPSTNPNNVSTTEK